MTTDADAQTDANGNAASRRKLEIPVRGMTCTSCAGRVDRALRAGDGVLEVRVDFAEQRASVSYDPARTTEARLVAAIVNAGYEVPAPAAEQ